MQGMRCLLYVCITAHQIVIQRLYPRRIDRCRTILNHDTASWRLVLRIRRSSAAPVRHMQTPEAVTHKPCVGIFRDILWPFITHRACMCVCCSVALALKVSSNRCHRLNSKHHRSRCLLLFDTGYLCGITLIDGDWCRGWRMQSIIFNSQVKWTDITSGGKRLVPVCRRSPIKRVIRCGSRQSLVNRSFQYLALNILSC